MPVWLICFIGFWPVLGCLCFVLGAEALVKGQISNNKAWGKKMFITGLKGFVIGMVITGCYLLMILLFGRR